jgi:polar amino acid transport system substrate-binding protein
MFELTDAIGLATFTVTGVVIAVRFGAEPLLLWGPLCAALSAAGGGILRDMLRADSDNPALHASFYAEISLLWGLILSLIVAWLGRVEQPHLLRIAVVLTVIGAFITRIMVVVRHVRSPQI